MDLGAIGPEIGNGLARLGLRAPVVSVLEVERIERTTGGKLKRFVPLGKQETAAADPVEVAGRG